MINTIYLILCATSASEKPIHFGQLFQMFAMPLIRSQSFSQLADFFLHVLLELVVLARLASLGSHFVLNLCHARLCGNFVHLL